VRVWTRDRAVLARTFLLATQRYWIAVFPSARREIRRWRERAETIPDATLRALALDTLETKWGNLEGAAAFAVFVPRTKRLTVARAALTWQAIYDFADTLTEQPCREHAANAHRLHGALLVAVTPGTPHEDYYAHHLHHDDAGYMTALVDASRTALLTLPRFRTIHDLVHLNARRIVRYQTCISQPSDFAEWARTVTPSDTTLRWWELGAACGSSMGIFALIAAAADPELRWHDAAAIERAYFPWIGSLHTLLDSLVDHHDDLLAGQHSLVRHYSSPEAAAERLHIIATEAVRRAWTLTDGPRHALLLAGMTSLYLSSRAASAPYARPSTERILDTIGGLGMPAMVVLGVRHAMRRRGVCDCPIAPSSDANRPG
jgi:tetraprenyl-beta-curcumene synthase